MDHRHASDARGDPAHDVGTDATVQMHQIRCGAPDQTTQAPAHGKVQIAAHGHAMHLGKGRRAIGQFAAATAGQQILDAARGEAFEQIQHLLRAAVEIGAALHV
jgi:hypothetical protein